MEVGVGVLGWPEGACAVGWYLFAKIWRKYWRRLGLGGFARHEVASTEGWYHRSILVSFCQNW